MSVVSSLGAWIGLLIGNEIAVGILHHEPPRPPMRRFGLHHDLRRRRQFAESVVQILDRQVNGGALPVDTVGPGVIACGMTLGKYNLDSATIENHPAGFILAAPRRHRAPAERITVKGYRAVEIRRRDKQMVEAILLHAGG